MVRPGRYPPRAGRRHRRPDGAGLPAARRDHPPGHRAVLPLAGVREVEVDLTVMTPRGAGGAPGQDGDAHGRAMATDPRGVGAPDGGRPPAAAPHRHQRPLGHEEGRPNPFGPQSRTRVIGISSGKGGVGKSSVTVNLAVALARAGHDVAVLDADVYGFSVPGMLGVDTEPTVDDQKMVPPEAYGVRCMSMGFFVDDDQPVIWRGPMLHKALEQFLVDVDWGDPEFLLVDMPPGTGDVALSMAQYLPTSEVYVVTTPQPAARRVAQRSAYMAKKLNLPAARGHREHELADGPGRHPAVPLRRGRRRRSWPASSAFPCSARSRSTRRFAPAVTTAGRSPRPIRIPRRPGPSPTSRRPLSAGVGPGCSGRS